MVLGINLQALITITELPLHNFGFGTRREDNARLSRCRVSSQASLGCLAHSDGYDGRQGFVVDASAWLGQLGRKAGRAPGREQDQHRGCFSL